MKHFELKTNFLAFTYGTAAKKTFLYQRKHEKSRFSHEITVSCYVTKKRNHVCFTTISKDRIENDIYANQTKWVLSKSFTDNQAQNVQTHSKKENMSLETNFPQFLHFYSEKM